VVKRARAVELVELVPLALDQGRAEWPLSLVTELYIFGSFARGAIEPHDVDIDVEFEIDQRLGRALRRLPGLRARPRQPDQACPDRRQARMPVPVQLPGPR